MSDSQTYGFPTNEKVTLKLGAADVSQIVDDVVQSLNKLAEAFHAVQDKKYGPALAAVLSVIQSLFVNQIVPHIAGK